MYENDREQHALARAHTHTHLDHLWKSVSYLAHKMLLSRTEKVPAEAPNRLLNILTACRLKQRLSTTNTDTHAHTHTHCMKSIPAQILPVNPSDAVVGRRPRGNEGDLWDVGSRVTHAEIPTALNIKYSFPRRRQSVLISYFLEVTLIKPF